MSRTKTFRELHSSESPLLILPNVWDAGGARIVESMGAKAIATTSGGFAWSKGCADGNVVTVQQQAQLASEVVDAVSIPVSVDFEMGYSDDPATVAENLKPLVETGISGINLEDSSAPAALLARKIEAIKAMTESAGLDVFINARTDVILRNLVSHGESVRETLRRAAIYQSAGADGLFVPGVKETNEIEEIVKGTSLPVNVLSLPNVPDASVLERLGVRRLSAGSAIARVIYQQVGQIASAFLAEGSYSPLENTKSYLEYQEMFKA